MPKIWSKIKTLIRKTQQLFRNNKKKCLAILSTVLAFIIVVTVVMTTLFTKKELQQYKIKKEGVYIYFEEEKFSFDGKITLDHDNNVTQILLNNKKVKLDSEPIYYIKQSKVIFPQNMSVVFPLSSGIQNKINYYTTLIKDKSDNYLKNKDLNYNLENAFIYDGNDLYFFIEDTKIIFDNQEIIIPPFSYVIATYDKNLYIYNYEEDKVRTFRNIQSDILATTNNYKINLSIDSLVSNNKTKLLMKNLDYLQKLK